MKTRFLTLFMLSLMLLILAACAVPTAAPPPPTAAPPPTATPEPPPAPDPASIVQALAAALNAGDLDAAMTLIADDAIFDMSDGEPLVDADQIRELFGYLIAGHFRIEATPKNTDGGAVTTDTKTWGDGIPGGGPNVATEVYVVEDGKITSITWTPTEETMAGMEATAIVQTVAEALNEGDVDAAVDLFADDALFQMNFYEETLVGVDQIRALFGELVAGNFRIEATPQKVDGGTVTTDTKTWGDGIPGDGPNVATEVYVVEDGKITSITWTPTEETIANLTAAMEATATLEPVKVAVNKAEDIVGVWESVDKEVLQFNADGTFRVAESLAGLVDQSNRGTYWFEGFQLIIADEDGNGGGSYKVELWTTEEGDPVSLKLSTIKEPYTERGDVLARVWYWSEAQTADEAQSLEPMFTVTFDGDQCIYNGPDAWPALTRIRAVLDVTDQDGYEDHGYVVVTLDEGKTLADLEAWPSSDQPLWAHLHANVEDVPPGTLAEKPTLLKDGPAYVVCFTAATSDHVTKKSVLGPFEVTAAMAEPDAETVEGPMFTITFNGSKCAYDGPEELPAQLPIIMRIDVENQDKSESYGASVITLEEGKGLSDLKALPATKDPPYVEIYGFMGDVMAGTSRQSTIEVPAGPVYIECIAKSSSGSPMKRIDALGPIVVAE